MLHGAGANTPRLLDGLSEDQFQATLAPKVAGLQHVLACLDPSRLRLCLAFGSLIARAGMRGEADYAVANEWLRLRLDNRLLYVSPSCVRITGWSSDELLSTSALAGIHADDMERVEQAIAALDIQLSPEEIARLDEPYRPHPVLGHS